MKFSIVATALLAQGIAAMPWTSVKSQSNGEEITLRIQVSGAGSESKYTPEPKGAIDLKNADVCLKVCWPDKPQCPEGWNAKKFGDNDYPCWTCCKTYNEGDL
ncbi:Ff.00g043150.m01.CDS01 [Fusarium sp. VM40]|nr:Ff.00g043150.m01.CDS01 [Fusarium sp. VM40]